MNKFERVLSKEDLINVYLSIDMVRVCYGEDRQSRAIVRAAAKFGEEE